MNCRQQAGGQAVRLGVTRFRKVLHRLNIATDSFTALLLVAMFVSFIIQVVMRYFLRSPVGWTVELSAITWIWVILWGQSVTVREEDEIRFDIVYGSVKPEVRRVFRMIFSVFLVVVYAVSLPAVIDFVLFMKIEETGYLDFRFDYVYSVYVIFAVAVIIRYAWIFIQSLRRKDIGYLHDYTETIE